MISVPRLLNRCTILCFVFSVTLEARDVLSGHDSLALRKRSESGRGILADSSDLFDVGENSELFSKVCNLGHVAKEAGAKEFQGTSKGGKVQGRHIGAVEKEAFVNALKGSDTTKVDALKLGAFRHPAVADGGELRHGTLEDNALQVGAAEHPVHGDLLKLVGAVKLNLLRGDLLAKALIKRLDAIEASDIELLLALEALQDEGVDSNVGISSSPSRAATLSSILTFESSNGLVRGQQRPQRCHPRPQTQGSKEGPQPRSSWSRCSLWRSNSCERWQ